MALMTEVSTWAITAGHAEPIKIDLIDGNKQWKTLNVKLNWWLWRRELPSYAVFFATLVGLSALVQAAFSSVFGGHQ